MYFALTEVTGAANYETHRSSHVYSPLSAFFVAALRYSGPDTDGNSAVLSGVHFPFEMDKAGARPDTLAFNAVVLKYSVR